MENCLLLKEASSFAVSALIDTGSKVQGDRKEESLTSDQKRWGGFLEEMTHEVDLGRCI